jgi:hypothetical protein
MNDDCYKSVTISNYVRVRDADEFENIVNRLITSTESAIVLRRGNTYAFSMYGTILGLQPEDPFDTTIELDCTVEDAYYAFKEVIDPRDILTITEVGHEGLTSYFAETVAISHNDINYINLKDSTKIIVDQHMRKRL